MGVIAGVYYLHTHSPIIVHGDLKLVSIFDTSPIHSNYTVDPKGNILIDEQWNARLCDFGISRMLTEAGESGDTTTSPHTGTARYLSYELLHARAPTTASDVYALACTGLEVG